MTVSGVTMVRDASLIKIKTIKEKTFNQLPWLENNKNQGFPPEKTQVLGLVKEGIVIFQETVHDRIFRANLLNFVRWKGFKDTEEVMEGFRQEIPQIFFD